MHSDPPEQPTRPLEQHHGTHGVGFDRDTFGVGFDRGTFGVGFDRDTFGVDTRPDAAPQGDRWSSWDGAVHGPTPRPDWVVTALGAVDEDLGVLKTGKEADVSILRRFVPAPDGGPPTVDVLMAAKRFRDGKHRMFHRDSGYLEGRRVRDTRAARAMRTRTDFGKRLLSAQWAEAEFAALSELWQLGLPVPYPVQIDDTELLMEFIGTDGAAAPRLARTRPDADVVARLYEQFVTTMNALVNRGWTHGDLSPYNVLLQADRLVIIDWPQIVDVVANPRGPEFLHRDVHNMTRWFCSRGLTVDAEDLFGDLMGRATSHW